MEAATSNDRFTIDYDITVPAGGNIDAIAADIAIEQTVEAPMACIPASHWDNGLIGKVESVDQVLSVNGLSRVAISYRCDITAYTVPQFFNTLFGNISLKNNIRIVNIRPAEALAGIFKGPTFGISGIRKLTNTYGRPLACTALKPMGLPVSKLADMAYAFAKGGIDFIKDDHGITDQAFHPFEQRAVACQEAVTRANAETGGKTMYFPSLCESFDKIEQQVKFALNLGIKGFLVAPMLTGFDFVRYLAQEYKPVIVAHPALTGAYFSTTQHGIAPDVFLGLLFRLLGADISVFPNAGGRFPLTKDECLAIADSLRKPLPPFKDSFPCPAGGMSIERVSELKDEYGNDSVFLIGGSLITASNDLAASTSAFMEKIRG